MPRLTLSVRNVDDARTRDALERVVRTASLVDGQPPFSDQSLIDAASGARTLILAVEPQDPPVDPDDFAVVGAAILGHGELEFVVEPEWRGHGYGRAALRGVLANCPPQVRIWAHGDHPASRVLAQEFGFSPVRTLLQLRLTKAPTSRARPATTGHADVTVGTFRPGVDEEEWLEVNALAFADHPEQGRMTLDDLRAREAESWFDADDFLLARGSDGDLLGFIWLKVEDTVGEVYAVGVHPAASGRGLGRLLMEAGLARLRDRRVEAVTLYVEADNLPAVSLYRSLGFTDHTIDVQYARTDA
ncbi:MULTISPECIES: mycothiol synthase [Plantibacter]|uniref:mycothiol synthase n=1 Tax=Plantibacter TaxID=190323 RepID=UPI0012F399C1|nr:MULTISPECIES: mycothiol synthase [Plantibacter]MDD9152309.1 mycothiol synthase [Plantibacter flavus]VXB86374.1 Mycothiol acetyltransferase [Plantibacter sp. T3]